MSLFHHNISFTKHDPLDDGLSDDIRAEQHEVEAFKSLDDISGDDLADHWGAIVNEAKKDPDWFSFSED